jgi:hypothetical protein
VDDQENGRGALKFVRSARPSALVDLLVGKTIDVAFWLSNKIAASARNMICDKGPGSARVSFLKISIGDFQKQRYI